MTLTIELKPETEDQLKNRAAAQVCEVDEYVRKLIEEDSAEKVLSNLDQLIKQENSVEDDEILGLWADREESAEKIARELRRGWNRK